ncbi:hypothetical protein BDP27DRAFT_1379573 [Rhodocollybia butyracea]|uniref:Polynucleotide 5'-hydroxyl-kinase GRC3 n=1 Tax=Rhodocollybia butyracea TaxID=206335 RepID=A0A9P5UFD5_9AGAR|nr:hypothetical protein BDP27DRAFT_1379573 [Rhodocollybia butyracea]
MSDFAKEWVLEAETEFRFELDVGASLAITLVRGQAEIFGAELVERKPYLFGSECKAAVFTWVGCTIEMSQPSTEYVSEETPMAAYGNLHIAFEQMRVRTLAKLRGSPVPEAPTAADPPRIMVLGPENSGKTTICKTFGWSPILVNLDPNEGGWAAPGAVSAAAVHGPIPTSSPANPLGSASTSAPTTLASNAILPIVYWWAAGIIVDTPSSFGSGPATNDHRQKLIRACIDAFRINTILVVGHEKLNVEMQRAFGSLLTVVKIPKSGGVVELDHSYRERVHMYQLHAYMYGETLPFPPGIKAATQGGETLTDFTLSPSSTVVNFSDLTIYRIGAETMAPSSALPIGALRVVSEMQPVPVDPSQPGSGLLNAVLAVLSHRNPDENERYDEELLDLTVVGFIVVTNLDIAHKKNDGSLANTRISCRQDRDSRVL